MNLAQLAQTTIANFMKESRLPEGKADILAEPLLQELRNQGIIKGEALVEWQGVYEFQVIPVFYFKDDEECSLNVNPDGTIDYF